MKNRKFSAPTTTFRIKISTRDAVKVQAEIKGQSIREFIDRALLAAVNRPTKITRTANEF